MTFRKCLQNSTLLKMVLFFGLSAWALNVWVVNAWAESDADNPANPVLEMYATDWCTYCAQARVYLSEHGIAYVEYDIEKDAAAAERHDGLLGDDKMEGIVGVPLFVIGDRTLLGFEQSALDALLEQ